MQLLPCERVALARGVVAPATGGRGVNDAGLLLPGLAGRAGIAQCSKCCYPSLY